MASSVSVNVDQLQELVNEVRRTKRAQTLRLADDVIAVVMPERLQDVKNAKRRLIPPG